MDTLLTLFKTVLCHTWEISLDAPKSSSSEFLSIVVAR